MHHEQVLTDAVARVLERFESAPFTLRAAGPDDTPVVLGLLDAAVVWLNARGNTEQWGTTSFSGDPKRVAAVERWAGSGGAVVALRDDLVAGALVVGEATSYVPPATEPELYVVALVGNRDERARGAGRALLAFAEAVARELEVSLLRVDCYAGGDGQLVRFYESAGYTATDPFEVQGWPGQVLELRLSR
jgi:GNAT superfamily N-acetyltransferase